jgi:DNA topoisomerase-1
VTLETALECIRAKLETDANRLIRQFDEGIQVLNGRYGPYISDGEKNARAPKDRDPRSLTLEECRGLLAAAAARPMRGRFARRGAGKGATASAASGTAGTPASKRKSAAPRNGGAKGAAANDANGHGADGESTRASTTRKATRAPADTRSVPRPAERKPPTARPHGRGALAAAAKRGIAKTRTAARSRVRPATGKKTAGV